MNNIEVERKRKKRCYGKMPNKTRKKIRVFCSSTVPSRTFEKDYAKILRESERERKQKKMQRKKIVLCAIFVADEILIRAFCVMCTIQCKTPQGN